MIGIVCLLSTALLVAISCAVVHFCKRDPKQNQKQTDLDARKSAHIETPDLDLQLAIDWNETPEQYVHDTKHEKDSEIDPFIDGLYAGYYRQQTQNFQLPEFMLRFEDDSVVKGWGKDNAGHFHIQGIFSSVTHRMFMQKTYFVKNDENDDDIALGEQHDEHAQALYSVQVRLEFEEDEDHDQFKGEYFVSLEQHKGCGLWEMSKVDQHETDDDYEEDE
eukprot:CAMPEP_0202688984 /NCGR_PEP_ID=MMETSP1385-20130828/4363_1 /ASSEMBLY_ACC=CAM_ASM_000861 /TAXON_ID=933848 /ORGANISM="Elphidium margaritaceum" /LENGTH=218 /DNA_ID=CAMNT_0049344057 /DNA_START=105 /DNA_END=761 /DNA_ORIENTATION=+